MKYLVLFICLGSLPAFKTQLTKPKTNGFAVIELFTSEGCSSCPAADEVVARIAKDYKTNVYVLGFHVDYWDRLGWKDAFSTSLNTSRQQQYAAAFNLQSIYTPQVVVNGRTEFVGSDESRLRKTVQDDLSTETNTSIKLDTSTASGKLVIAYNVNLAKSDQLNIALVQLMASSNVKRGENSGRKLNHINIVRAFKTVTDNAGKIIIDLPSGLSMKECTVIAFTQNKTTQSVTGARSI